MDSSTGVIAEVDPRTLLTPLRLDYVIKWRFFRAILSKTGDSDAERVYRWHIHQRTRGIEPRSHKRSVNDYVHGCYELLASLQIGGFRPEGAIQYGPTRLIVGSGAHRVSASLALGIPLLGIQVERDGKPRWDKAWFMRHRFPENDWKRLMADWETLRAPF